ncbi:MAG: glycosyltransferase family 9 protein [Deltaproteobacteria bacterium]|nr:glycosyltransferase family 9 protein [Deltaproteobacteria bacterium]
MKILVVNLLRLGDVISMAPALKALRMAQPNAQIDLLVNAGVETVTPIIPGISQVHVFERTRMQSALVDGSRPMFESFDVLGRLVERLSEEKYDVLYNFTHNRLSGWLCGLIPAGKKIGLALDGAGGVSFGSAWFRHLNQQVDFEEAQCFHHSDVFFAAVGGLAVQREQALSDRRVLDGVLCETTKGRSEATVLLKSVSATMTGERSPLVLMQISTSDRKKEWGDQQFRTLARHLLNRHSNATIFVLGASSEETRIQNFCRSVESDQDRLIPAICSLEAVVSLLESADVLITGDTSIKHIASASTARVIELAVGSSDPFRTGPWKSGDVVIAGREACRPCGHSEGCHRESHFCATAIDVEEVAVIVDSYILEPETVAKARASIVEKFDVFVVDRSEGLVQLNRLNGPGVKHGASDREIAVSVERTARRLILESKDGRLDRMTMGSEIRFAYLAIKQKFPHSAVLDFRHSLNSADITLRHSDGMVRSLRLQLDRVKESIQDPKRLHELVSSIAVMRSRLGASPWTAFIVEPLLSVLEDDRSAPFTRYRRLADTVGDLELRIEMALKLIRGLEIEIENELESDLDNEL